LTKPLVIAKTLISLLQRIGNVPQAGESSIYLQAEFILF